MFDRINEAKRSKNGFLFEAGRFLTGRWRWCWLASDASWEDRVGVRKPRVCGCPASEGSLGRFDASSRMRMYDVEAGRYHVTHPMFFLWNGFGCLATIFLLIAIQFNFWFWLFHNQVLTSFLLQKVRSHYLFRIFGRASRAFDTYLSVGLVCSMSLRSSKMPIPIHVSCIFLHYDALSMHKIIDWLLVIFKGILFMLNFSEDWSYPIKVDWDFLSESPFQVYQCYSS